jgi:hypothetical protein
MRTPPPTREQWRLAGELGGHSVAESVAYLAACADYEDEQAQRRRALPPGVITFDDAEPAWLTKVRRWFGR